MNPIHSDEKGWLFWDETWADRLGPYPSEAVARERLGAYVEFLNTGRPMAIVRELCIYHPETEQLVLSIPLTDEQMAALHHIHGGKPLIACMEVSDVFLEATDNATFAAEALRQSRAVSESPQAAEDMAFVEGLSSDTPDLKADQVWVPPIFSMTDPPRTIVATKAGYVSYRIPDRCPCCDTLIWTESEAVRDALEDDFLQWIALSGARLARVEGSDDHGRGEGPVPG